jgi:hypothetical protein
MLLAAEDCGRRHAGRQPRRAEWLPKWLPWRNHSAAWAIVPVA